MVIGWLQSDLHEVYFHEVVTYVEAEAVGVRKTRMAGRRAAQRLGWAAVRNMFGGIYFSVIHEKCQYFESGNSHMLFFSSFGFLGFGLGFLR